MHCLKKVIELISRLQEEHNYTDMSVSCGICFSKTNTVMIIITLDTHKHNKQNHKRKIP